MGIVDNSERMPRWHQPQMVWLGAWFLIIVYPQHLWDEIVETTKERLLVHRNRQRVKMSWKLGNSPIPA